MHIKTLKNVPATNNVASTGLASARRLAGCNCRMSFEFRFFSAGFDLQ